mmetsp:Transcript_52648/g.127631  ORF Transcript_52648/g.127631 Transcript_52648/m.127631 type:complete len:248 (-) Transcript_52648:1991-2734(-)
MKLAKVSSQDPKARLRTGRVTQKTDLVTSTATQMRRVRTNATGRSLSILILRKDREIRKKLALGGRDLQLLLLVAWRRQRGRTQLPDNNVLATVWITKIRLILGFSAPAHTAPRLPVQQDLEPDRLLLLEHLHICSIACHRLHITIASNSLLIVTVFHLLRRIMLRRHRINTSSRRRTITVRLVITSLRHSTITLLFSIMVDLPHTLIVWRGTIPGDTVQLGLDFPVGLNPRRLMLEAEAGQASPVI